jgi:outer membrane protein, multidrug efflux system
VVEAWWYRYQSPGLAAWVEATLSRNRDFAASLARLDAARASLKVASAGLSPSLDASADLSGSATSSDVPRDNPEAGFGLSLNYEVDLWRRNAARRAAGLERVEASEFDRDALALSLAGDSARAYVRVLGFEARARIAEENLVANREVLKLLELRFREGASGRLEVEQQRTAVAQVEASLAALRRDARLNLQALAVLVADPERPFPVDELAALSRTPPRLLPPSRLVAVRPDIRRAEAELAAASADVSVARAALLPQLTLSGLESFQLNPVTVVASLAAGLVQPIFRGGALTGEVERSAARERELTENYVQTVLIAWREVEDALATLNAANEREAALLRATQAARAAYELALTRFKAGAVDFLTVLNTQTARLQSEDAQAQAGIDALLADIALALAQAGWNGP